MPKQPKRYDTNYNLKRLQSDIKINRLKRRITQLENSMSHNSTSENEKTTKPHFFERYGTVSDIAIVIFSLLTTIATLLIFSKSIDAANASVRSADAADSTFRKQKRMYSLNRIADSIKDINDSIRFAQTFQLSKEANENSQAISKATLQQQINSLEETQKEFRIENSSYVQIVDFHFDTTDLKNDKIIMSFKLNNIGKTPAKVLKTEYYITYNIDSITKPATATLIDNNYISLFSTSSKDFIINIKDHAYSEALMNGTGSLFFGGEIHYINIGDKQPYTLFFLYQTKFSPSISTNTLKNDIE